MKFSEHIQIAKRAIKHLFTLSRRYTICLILHSVLKSLLPYVPIYFSARLIDALYERQPVERLTLYILLTVGLVFVLSLANVYVSSRQSILSNELYRNEEWMFSEKAMQMAYSSIEDPEVTLLRERIAMEAQTGYNLYRIISCTENGIFHLTRIVLSCSMTLPLFLLKELSLSLKLALVGGILLTVAWEMFSNRKSEKTINAFFEAGVKMNVLGEKYYNYMEHYSSGKDIRLYDMADSLLDFNVNTMHEYNKGVMKQETKIAALKAATVILSHILRFGIYLMLIRAALSGSITVGSIAQYVSCIMLLLTANSGLISEVQKALLNHGHLKRYFSYFDIPNPMYQGSLTVEKRDDNEYFVEFRDVSFCYPNTENYALRHVNLKFKIGEKLAVVGVNGSGKTTFIKLMCRLYDPTEGEILLNGVNIKKYDYDEYMSIFSIVFQDFRLFSFRLGENVAAGPQYDTDKAARCLRQAGFGERLSAMPAGVDSYLYKSFDGNGVEISGGESQKIALARALYKNAPFLILDEPTSALDPVSEYEVYSKFNEIAGDKTAIYISHRLASCRFCDKIAVFDGGEIIQTGSHDTLIAQENGKYHELWQAQAQYYVRR
ncbi:ABC transporter ATP-binding protein [Acetatifactor muris]|uniref:ABC transporter ATP-binding protein n=1 Tax=Acetatifactor muris TaxID=879566 RepID=UPI0023F4E471|nr:ABC transporter ATP-binding protein [Acetatifactor muris]